MLVPLILLAIGAAAAGYVFHSAFLGHHHGHADAFWGPSIKIVGEDVLEKIHHIPPFWKWLPTAGMVIGLLLALNSYMWNRGAPAAFVRMFSGLHAFLFNKWYFDELYSVLFVKPSLWFGRLFWKGDGKVIDGIGPDGVSALVSLVSRRSRAIQSGYVYHYAFAMLIGVVAALSWMGARMLGH